MATRLGAVSSDTNYPSGQAAADAELSGQSIATVTILGNVVAVGASNQTAIDNIIADINDLKAKLRAADVLAT